MPKDIELLYVVNARIPNKRAHGIQIVHTCEALGNEKLPLTLITSIFSGDKDSLADYYGISQTFTHKRIFCIDIPGLPFRYMVRNVSFFISLNLYLSARYIKKLFTNKDFAVYVRGETVLALLPLSYFIPIFFETHQIRNYERWYRFALLRAKGIIVVTEGLKRKFIEEYRIDSKKILVARDAVDLARIRNTSKSPYIWEQHAIPPQKKIALYAGTLSKEKGVDVLAKAAEYVSSDVQIVFLGGTEEQVTLFREKYGSVSNISILGRVEYPEVPTYLVSAHVLVLPDSDEFTYSNLYTSPMKMFEYMATGNPIVASKVPSLSEVLNEINSLFFKPGAPEALAQAIEKALGDTVGAKHLAEKARQVVSEFTWEKRAEKILHHIQTCLVR